MLKLSDAFSGITANAAIQLNLKTKPMPDGVRVRIEGQKVVHLATVPALQMDRLTASDLDIPEIPSLGDADGTLALDILGANDLELDLAHDKLNLFSRDHCSGKVVYWPSGSGIVTLPLTVQKSGNVLTTMMLDGQKLQVALKAESPSEMGMNVARRIFGINEHTSGLQMIGTESNGISVYRYPFTEIAVEGLKITNPDISIYGNASDPECIGKEHIGPRSNPEVTWCFGGADLFLGPSVLKRLHLFFAFGEKMLYVTAASN